MELELGGEVHELEAGDSIDYRSSTPHRVSNAGEGTAEVMYQTYASVEKDAPEEVAATAGKGPTYLYMEVDDLDAVVAAMKDVKLVMPVRTAFYGMREFSVQDPGGHFITFAQPVAPPKQ